VTPARTATAAVLAAWLLTLPAIPALAAEVIWKPAGETASEHLDQTATLLHDGRVLVVGGHQYNSGSPSPVELYDPASGSWKPGPPTGEPRSGHAAVRLDDGRVLVAGGVADLPDGQRWLASAELFDPRSDSWSPAASMAAARYHPTLTVLPDGRVLVAGGADADEVTAAAEVYDPVADRWSPVPPMSTPRMDAAALLLRTGQVLVAGGQADTTESTSLNSAELFDYRTDGWRPAPNLRGGHADAIAAVMPDGSALVAGGFDFAGGFRLATSAAEYYDPVGARWSAGPPLQLARGLAGYARLGDGSVLAVGGQSRVANVRTEATGEVLDPRSRRWTLLPSSGLLREQPTVTALLSGAALVVGGGREQAAQLYLPAAAPPGTAETLGQALAGNGWLLLATGGLILAVLAQLGWRRRRAQLVAGR